MAEVRKIRRRITRGKSLGFRFSMRLFGSDREVMHTLYDMRRR